MTKTRDALRGLRWIAAQDPVTYDDAAPIPVKQVFNLFNAARDDVIAALARQAKARRKRAL